MVTGKKQKNGSAKGQLFFSDVKIMMNNMYIEKQCQDLRPDTDLPTI